MRLRSECNTLLVQLMSCGIYITEDLVVEMALMKPDYLY